VRISFHGEVILPDRTVPDTYVNCEDGVIVSVAATAAAGSTIVEGRYIGPGYVDIHVHGGAGSDYMDGDVDAVLTANRAHGRHGTTTILPTTTTGSPEEIKRMFEACAEVRASWSVKDGARIGGIHYYGPYFATEKVGCHLPSGRRDPDPAEYKRALATGLIRVATCAAELPGSIEFYRTAFDHGCLVTCGHSNATWSEMEAAFAAGVRHVDHFWNAMSSVTSIRARFGTPAQGSMEQFVLAYPDMSTEVIADGLHLAPELLNFAFRMKGPKRLCLVTDANRALDMPPGHYRFGPKHTGVWIESDGQVGFIPNKGLASSVVGMDHMVRHMAAHTTATVADTVRMASLTPAERCGLSDRIGSLEAGKLADILVLDENLNVQRVYLGGDEFYSA
jgi:N-acetylglucosamine-6-phosphate deacetylase